MLRQALQAAVVGGTLCAAAGVQAQQFGIESKVFAGRELVASGTTLFADGRVYDFLIRPDETIVQSLDEGQIDLLDNVRQVRTQVSAEDLKTFCDGLRNKAAASAAESVRFCADPEFRERLDPETNELVLESAWMEYRARTIAPPNAEILRHYETYVTRQTQVNALLNPGSPPPGPRLALNTALSQRQALAERVSLRRTTSEGEQAKTLEAEHHFTWRLDEPDRQRIAEAERRRTTYRYVTPTEYVRAVAESARR
jgi:hypothetical protein